MPCHCGPLKGTGSQSQYQSPSCCCARLCTSSAKVWSLVRHLPMHSTCAQVRDYLFSQADLNLTRSDEASVASNVLYMMELLPPPKAAALAYLDSGGQAPQPPRQATPPSSTFCSLQALSKACSLSLRPGCACLPCPILQGSDPPAAVPEALWSLSGNTGAESWGRW